MALVKYVAPGFTTDSGRLLRDFVEAKSLDFSVFAKLWTERSFPLVYMGRPSEAELTEFTQEIFCLSARFLTTESSIYARVGAVYLLYALFRNQILVPPLRIRMVREQFEVVAGIRKALAAGPKHRTLRYVIDYLCQHGVDWVASPTLLGPMVPSNREKLSRDVFEANPALTDSLKSNLTDMVESMALQELCQISGEYLKRKTSMQLADVDKGFSESACRKLTQFTSRLEDLVQGDASRKTRAGKGIGSRRTYLKLKAMGQKRSDEAVQGSSSSGSRQRRSGAEKVENPVQGDRPLSKAEVLKKFNKRMKPKAFGYDQEYWAPSEDYEAFSKSFAESAYWKEKVLDIDGSESDDDVDSPLSVEVEESS